MTDCEKMANLNEYLIRNLDIEIMNTEMDAIVPVVGEIKAWTDAKQDPEVIAQLQKYKGYNCVYCIDSALGGLIKQGYTIINDDMEYVGFVETV